MSRRRVSTSLSQWPFRLPGIGLSLGAPLVSGTFSGFKDVYGRPRMRRQTRGVDRRGGRRSFLQIATRWHTHSTPRGVGWDGRGIVARPCHIPIPGLVVRVGGRFAAECPPRGHLAKGPRSATRAICRPARLPTEGRVTDIGSVGPGSIQHRRRSRSSRERRLCAGAGLGASTGAAGTSGAGIAETSTPR